MLRVLLWSAFAIGLLAFTVGLIAAAHYLSRFVRSGPPAHDNLDTSWQDDGMGDYHSHDSHH